MQHQRAVTGGMPRRKEDPGRPVAEDVVIPLHQHDLTFVERLVQLRAVAVLLIVRTNHGSIFEALDKPGRVWEERGVANVIKMCVRKNDRADVCRTNAYISKLTC